MIRLATEQDLEELSRLFDLYRQFYEQPSNILAGKEFLSERMANQESVLFVSEDERHQRLTGFTQLYPLFSSVRLRSSWLLNDLFVHEEYRRQGHAEALIQAAVDFCKDMGGRHLMLQTAKTNDRAQKLYEKLGWKKDDKFYSYYFFHDTKS